MIRRSTWIVLIVFIVLLGALLFWQQSNFSQQAEPTATPRTKVFDFDLDQMVAFSVANADGEQVSFAKADDGTWTLVQPEGELDPAAGFETKLNLFGAMRAMNVLESPPQMDEIGLDKPAYKVRISLNDGSESTLLVGSETPTGSGYYVHLDGGQVLVIERSTINDVTGLIDTPPLVKPEATDAINADQTPEATGLP